MTGRPPVRGATAGLVLALAALLAGASCHHVWNQRIDVVNPMLDTFIRGAWPAGVRR